jgi:hypothetical protein
MKLSISSLFATLLFASIGLTAGEVPAPKAGSPEFERMKTLVGTWTGKVDYGQGPTEATIQYRLIAAGTVLEERIGANTPMEMVSMYFDKAGKLAMTHYCVMGNRPEMALKSSDAKSITFDLDASCCTIDPKKESHMKGVTINFDDANTITSSCRAIIDGKEMPAHPVTFKRVKSETASVK